MLRREKGKSALQIFPPLSDSFSLRQSTSRFGTLTFCVFALLCSRKNVKNSRDQRERTHNTRNRRDENACLIRVRSEPIEKSVHDGCRVRTLLGVKGRTAPLRIARSECLSGPKRLLSGCARQPGAERREEADKPHTANCAKNNRVL